MVAWVQTLPKGCWSVPTSNTSMVCQKMKSSTTLKLYESSQAKGLDTGISKANAANFATGYSKP